jgi:hypothetical protein
MLAFNLLFVSRLTSVYGPGEGDILRELDISYESSFIFYMRFLMAPPTYVSAAVTLDKQASE